MIAESPLAFLRRLGVELRQSGREIIIDCPRCGKAAHCHVNSASWLWNCKRCGARGNERTLKVALGVQIDVSTATERDYERAEEQRLARQIAASRPRSDVERWTADLLSHPDAETARRYLVGRGISIDLARRYWLGWSAEPDGSTPRRSRRRLAGAEEPAVGPGWIVIPALTTAGDPSTAAVVKLRSVPPAERAFRRLIGGDSVLFAPNGINASAPLLIVGGEIDALSCIAAGWSNVVSSTVGEAAWKPEATSQLEAAEDIVIAYDSDDAGRRGALSLVETLGAHRCRVASWPTGYKDANAALVALGETLDVSRIVEQSRAAGQDGVVRIRDLRDAYLQELRGGRPRGISSGWPDLDRLVGGVRMGEVTLITGDTASGKSTFASQFALHMARAGTPTLFAPFELGAKRQIAKFVRQASGSAPDLLSDQAIEATLDELDRLPLLLLQRYGTITRESVRQTLSWCIRRAGVRFVVLDHLHFMVQEGPDERQELDAMMRLCAEIAVDYRVHIVVVAHPRQHASSTERDRDNRIIQASDLKGSAGLKQLSDNIWSIWRPRKADRSDSKVDESSGTAVLYALKNRDDYGSEGSVAFRFDLQSARFCDPTEPPARRVVAELAAALPVSSEPRPRRLRVRRVEQESTTAPAVERRHWTEMQED
jgi:archaellum biogenesis ATPase FlaH/ribosomal protein L37AE/L43A